jgi:hypothetical protein
MPKVHLPRVPARADYSLQQRHADMTAAFIAAMYQRPPSDPANLDTAFRAVQVYYGDALVYESRLQDLYGRVLQQLAGARRD